MSRSDALSCCDSLDALPSQSAVRGSVFQLVSHTEAHRRKDKNTRVHGWFRLCA